MASSINLYAIPIILRFTNARSLDMLDIAPIKKLHRISKLLSSCFPPLIALMSDSTGCFSRSSNIFFARLKIYRFILPIGSFFRIVTFCCSAIDLALSQILWKLLIFRPVRASSTCAYSEEATAELRTEPLISLIKGTGTRAAVLAASMISFMHLDRTAFISHKKRSQFSYVHLQDIASAIILSA